MSSVIYDEQSEFMLIKWHLVNPWRSSKEGWQALVWKVGVFSFAWPLPGRREGLEIGLSSVSRDPAGHACWWNSTKVSSSESFLIAGPIAGKGAGARWFQSIQQLHKGEIREGFRTTAWRVSSCFVCFLYNKIVTTGNRYSRKNEFNPQHAKIISKLQLLLY